MKTLIKKINRILKDRRIRRLLTRFVSGSAALVVFVTTYALVLPAITMETEAQCGIEAHQHDDSCYEDVLACGLEESDGHTHGDSCYNISQELTCEIPEHQHDKTCYDEDGNLQCRLSEHEHTEDCYKEVRELTCTLEESEGHHHTDACYKKNLICGKEAHTHSPACYEKTETAAVAASAGYTAGVAYEVNDDDAADDFGSNDRDGLKGSVDITGRDVSEETGDHSDTDALEETGDLGDTDTLENTGDSDDTDALKVTSQNDIWGEADNADTFEAEGYSDSSEGAGSTAPSQEADNTSHSDWESPLLEESAAAGTTNVLPEDLENEELSDGYVPQLDSLIFDSVLNDHTAFYYFHPEEGQEVPANSVDITSWKPVDENTELAPTDMVKAYLAYTIPAGSLNETNQVARYRLPANLHLTEDQILAINSHENGIAAGYIDPETNTVPDEDAADYSEYLGAEAVEGTRRPDQAFSDGSLDGEQEYISATVKAENVFDEEGLYGEKGAYLGQDLIFVFSPYTIQKNQTTYDKDGNPTARGEKVNGWFAVDLNMDQIDWSEPTETILPVDEENQTTAAEGLMPERNQGMESVQEQIQGQEPKQEQDQTQEQAQTETDDNIQSQENTGKTTHTALQRIERIANIVFAAEGKDENNHKIQEISAELKLVQENEIEIENGNPPSADAEEQVETPEPDEGKDPSDEKSETDQTDNSDSVERTDSDDNGANADADSALAENKEGATEKAAPEYKDGTLEANGSGYKITMDYKADAQIPENAYLHVKEITRESDEEAYEACLEEARKSVPSDGTRVDDKASRFFDIEILVDEQLAEKNDDKDIQEELQEKHETDAENENSKPESADSEKADSEGVEAEETNSEITENCDSGIESTESETAKDEVEETDETKSANSESVPSTDNEEPVETAEASHSESDLTKESDEKKIITRKIEPAAPVSVNIQLFDTEISQKADEFNAEQYKVVHIAEDGTEEIQGVKAQTIESEIKDAEPDTTEGEGNSGTASVAPATEVQFEAESFSIYGVVYTVDFYWKVNGKEYVIHIPGGSYISFQKLVEVLGIAREKTDTLAEDKTSEEEQKSENGKISGKDQTSSDNQIIGTDQHTNREEKPTTGNQQSSGSIDEAGKENEKGTPAALDFTNVEVSENTRKFVADVDGIKFSNPSLLSVSKAEHSATVGAIKNALGLVCEYSAELTEEAVAEIDATVVEAGDWALISLKAFDTEETITVTMKDGEKFQIKVTDANEVGDSFNNKTYVISYDSKAMLARTNQYQQRVELVSGSENEENAQWTFEYDYSQSAYRLKSKDNKYIKLNKNNASGSANAELANNWWDGTLFNIRKNGDKIKLELKDSYGDWFLDYNENGQWDPYFIGQWTRNGDNIEWLDYKPYKEPLAKAGDWLLYFDEDLDEITIHVGETITLRPYDEWKWKESDVQRKYWNIDSTKDWTINGDEQDGDGFETWTPSGSPIEFTRYVKYDSQLETRYWSVQGQAKETGEFLLTNTENGHVIKVKVVDGDPVPVGTITKTAGIKVNLFDYDKEYVLDPYNSDTNKADSTHKNQSTNYNNKPLYFMSSGGGDAGDPDPSKINRYTKDKANPGIVNNRLNTEGYPQLASHSGNSGNLKYLFDTSQVEWAGGDYENAMKAYPDVEGLFQKDNDGYYYYNSNVNYAYYNPANNNKTITLYEHTYTQNSSQDKNSRVNTKPIGFFPFHPYNSTEDLWVNQNNHLNHHIGLSMEVEFTLPSNRLDENGKPIKFEFSGDDDLWVFVEWTKDDGTKDSRLLLDLGGIHQPITGSIDFTNDDAIKNIVNTDKPYTLKVFYLERGGCDSNCSIRFNLPITKELTVAKNVNGLTPAERLKYLDDLFTYEIGIRNDSSGLDMDKTEDEFWDDTSWREGFQLYNTKDNENTNTNKNHTVYHSKTGEQKGVPVKDGQIQLKEGESFTISQLPATDIFYLAEEDQLDMQQFEVPHAERMYIGKDGATRQEEEVALHEDHSAANSSMSDWETRPYALKDMERLVYTNTIQERNLDVDKVWQDGQSAHQPVQFRLLATVDGQHYGAATGHNSINAQWTETTNAGTITRTEDVYTYDASAGSSKLFTLNEDNNWHISFEHLPRKTESANDTGKEIIYSVQEVVPDDYTVTYTGPTDTGKVYLDLYKFWPDGNANHDGSEGKPAEHISTYIKNDVGQYMVAARGSNGEYVYTGMTDNQAEATRFELMTKSALPSGFQSNDQYNMFDYAARVNNVPDGSYYWDEETDEEEATRGMVMFKRLKQEIEILNKKAQINVEKEWLDKDGNALSDHPDSISYSIYQLKHEHEWAVYNTAEKKWDHTQKADGEGWYYIADENVDMRVCRFSSCGHYTETKPHHTEPCQENEHTWDDGEQTKAPTCTLPGSKTFTCTKCGSTRTEEVPASGHSFKDGEITTPATCSATGVKTYTCTVCNATKKEDIPKTDHTWGAWVTDPNNGLREIRECSVCHEKETRLNPNASTIPGTTIQLQDGVWPAGEHDDNEQITINPGVFEYGGKYYVVYGSKTNTWLNFKNGPDNVLGWGFVAKIDATKGVKNQGDNLNNLTAGQLLKMNDGTYYVWNNAYWGGPSFGPAQDNNWIKVPTSSNNVNGTNSLNTAAGDNHASKSMRKQAKIPVRTLGSENDDQGTEQTGRGPVTDMNLTLTQLLSDLNLTGLGVKNAQGDTLVKYGDSRTLTTTTGTLVENETNLWRETVGVPFEDENGNEYIYYVVEETPAVGGDYDVRYTGQSQGLTDGGTTRISNKVKPREVEVIVVKVDTGNTNTKLAGASFDLYAETSVEGGKVKDNETPLKTGLTTSDQTDQLGKVSLGPLTEGTYYLVETKAPNGYNTETSPIKIVVRDDKVSLTQGSSQRDSIITQDRAEVLVTNSAGVELPYTGGPGTRLFYLLGILLAGIAGAGLLLRKHRRLG